MDAYAHSAFPRSRLIDSLVAGGLESRGSFHARALRSLCFSPMSPFRFELPRQKHALKSYLFLVNNKSVERYGIVERTGMRY